MTSLTILLIIWVIMGLIIGNYASGIFKGKRPYGLGGDVIISLLTTVVVGVMGWYVARNYMTSFRGIPLSALIVLWLVRYFKK
jgi:uncharacterized membrane protein YeaQ/YmgE (transglycosylase-associated protein family)